MEIVLFINYSYYIKQFTCDFQQRIWEFIFLELCSYCHQWMDVCTVQQQNCQTNVKKDEQYIFEKVVGYVSYSIPKSELLMEIS